MEKTYDRKVLEVLLRQGTAAGVEQFNRQRGAGWLNLEKIDLSEMDVAGANLSDTNLFQAKLTRTRFWCTGLAGSNLSMVNLWGADCQQADLMGANLAGARCQEVNFWGANIWGIRGLSPEQQESILTQLKRSWQ